MRKWFYILLLCLPILSCVGQKDDPVPEVRLTADLTALNVTAGEQATFTVFSGTEDVTADAIIRNVTDGTDLEGNVFTPTQEGEWTFIADFDGVESESLTVTAIEIAEVGKDYFRRSLVLDFTGTWCPNCPNMQVAIDEVMEARPGRIIPVSVHCMADPMRVKPLCDNLAKRFSVTAYPSAVVDLDPESLFINSSSELLLSHIDRLLEARGPAAGVRIETALEGEELTVTAEMTAVREGDYSLEIILLEDGIVYAQKGSKEDYPDYVHNSVLRQWFTQDSSPLKEEETGSVSVTATVSGKYRVVALVSRNGIVDNVVQCTAGTSVDYQFEENNE
ncbi:MAG: Omp28-related outer membrane protein [Bacteroidales bacterium]|nr:Omp28-related outer membrane protein [Bacteroidales bacterium]